MRWSVRSLALAQVVLVLAACSAVPGTTSSTTSSPSPITSSPLPTARAPATLGESRAVRARDGVGRAQRVEQSSIPIPTLASSRRPSGPLEAWGLRRLEEARTAAPGRTSCYVVLDGPVEASGYDWFQVQPVIAVDTGIGSTIRSVGCGGRQGRRALDRATRQSSCPPRTERRRMAFQSANLVAGVDLYYRVTCFGGHEFTFTARLAAPDSRHAEPVSFRGPSSPPGSATAGAGTTFLAPLDDVPEAQYCPVWTPGVDTSIAWRAESERRRTTGRSSR